jgi:hypothetical protein
VKGTRLHEIKPIISSILKKEFNIDEEFLFQFTFKCGCPPMKMTMNDLPLENSTCLCGKTKIFELEMK